jgi:hypothetical protein
MRSSFSEPSADLDDLSSGAWWFNVGAGMAMSKYSLNASGTKRFALLVLLLGGITVAAWFFLHTPDAPAPTPAPGVLSPTVTPAPGQLPSTSYSAVAPTSSAASAPIAPTAPAPKVQSVDWRKLRANDDLKAWLSTVQASDPADQRYAAWSVLQGCIGHASVFQDYKVLDLETAKLQPFLAYKRQPTIQVARAYLDAHQRFDALCKSIEVSALDKQIDGASALRDSSYGRLLVASMKRKGVEEGRPNFVAALTLVLSNPAEYAQGFDFWLNYVLWARDLGATSGLSMSERAWVEELLYARFIPDSEQSAWRYLRCATRFKCAPESMVSPERRPVVLAFVDKVEYGIRTQRWDMFM